MPIPNPKEGEDKKTFMDRCLSDDVMNSEYPDSDQRYAVCNTAWEGKEKKSETPQMETRSFNFELRTSEENPSRLIGHAAVFEKLSDPLPVLGGRREKVKKGAFSQSIKEDDIRALWNHDPNYILGRNKAGTLRLFEDEQGLGMEIDTPDTQFARDLMVSIKRGDVTQMSFAFGTIEDSWDDKRNVRTLHRVKLYDVSPVTFPAYPQTDIKARNILSKKGIDFDKLTLALEKRDSGQDLSVEERDVISKTVDVLAKDDSHVYVANGNNEIVKIDILPVEAGAEDVRKVASELELALNDNLRRRINLL